ncbi:NitT/TauT family transport system ATP-binding protein [Palleronia marisminoris]|uniref:Nitrate transport protein NrtA n=1 Tax=Palleronia marisminoris TaxID=315423 RepID=A0A1Y5S706_9RHOB|nr:CmpA/NrtA family ABC transporter substrate-binding protein [Palleronia marisminoris]SFG66006.1 NitT/TauT family transport system ATP-binding protein [Palleronia marisminoris]SLN33890.1 Nitrate transport protein NrtA precursor [Palleronia marisminoris]
MRATALPVGFLPLVDAAPLIVAEEMGFAAEEGLALDFLRAPSWASLRDALVHGQVRAAHMLAPVPIASALGVGGGNTPLAALSVLSVNGNVVGVSAALAERMREAGHRFGFDDAAAAGQALIAAAEMPLRIGVPFPFSMHAELIYHWLSALGLPSPQSLIVRTVPPPLMAEAIRAHEIDAFCVGEPWGTAAVEGGVGELLLPGNAIWAFAPEKILAARADWADEAPDLSARLVRSVWRAGRWLDAGAANRSLAADLMSRPHYLNLAPDLIERALSGRIVVSPRGETRATPRFVVFHEGAAAFPWRSQAAWIGARIAGRMGLDQARAMAAAAGTFRSDLFREALSTTGAILPAASARIEGALAADQAVPAMSGSLTLCRDAFFDGAAFDPAFLNRP